MIKFLYGFKLFESIKSEEFLEKITRLFFDAAIEKLGDSNEYRNSAVNNYYIQTDDSEINDFLSKNTVLFYFMETPKVDGKLVNGFHKYNSRVGFYEIAIRATDNLEEQYHVAIHEFRHALDHSLSNGKAIEPKKDIDYINQPAEISARYSQAISYMLKNNLFNRFEISLSYFKEKMKFDKIKLEKTKKRLLNRFYMHWDFVNKNRTDDYFRKKNKVKFKTFYNKIKDENNILSYDDYIGIIRVEKTDKPNFIKNWANKNGFLVEFVE